MDLKSIVIKIIFILVSLIYITNYFKNEEIQLDPSTYKINTLYTDSTKEINDFRIESIEMFFEYVKKYEYEKAFALLDDISKNVTFNGNIEIFKNTMERTYIDENVLKKDISYDFVSESQFNEKEILFRVSLTAKNNVDSSTYKTNKSLGFYYPISLDIILYEVTPFNHKFYLRIPTNNIYREER